MRAAKKAHLIASNMHHSESKKMKTARNLSKKQLGGVIFGCTNGTMRECLSKQLFGLPSAHFSYVKHIKEGMPLFLFNYSERKLYGIYEAASPSQLNIDLYAWTQDDSDRTKYPAQVRVRLRLECQGLDESLFKPIIIDNYYSENHFWFELDHSQLSHLISKLSSLAIAPRPSLKHKPLKSAEIPQKFPKDKEAEFIPNSSSYIGSSDELLGLENMHLSNTVANSDEQNLIHGKLKKLSAIRELSEATRICCVIGATSTTGDDMESENRNQDVPTSDELLGLENMHLSNTVANSDEQNLIHGKVKKLSAIRELSEATRIGCVSGATSTTGDDMESENRNQDVPTSSKNPASSLDCHQYPSIVEKLYVEIEDLKAFKQEQTQKIDYLEKKLAKAEAENNSLAFDTSIQVSESQRHVEPSFELNELILIVGGYDGEACSSSFNSFSTSHDYMRSLQPMSTARAYASVARLNGEIYVLGGRNSSRWYDTVESYDAARDEWTLRPSLNKSKCSLGGAVVNGNIFAVGGGNGAECFSDVEMFDPWIGKWIYARSMLQKRFAVNAVELNGAIYAVGGYDGKDYLSSAERFDPREHNWSGIASMHSKRGCLALVTMNEKLYALGGFDGVKVIPSTEVYDPRIGKWTMGEPMNEGRVYLSAAVLNETIYAIGGVRGDQEIVENIECYKEGGGWEETNLKAVGKRCFASAIVLESDG